MKKITLSIILVGIVLLAGGMYEKTNNTETLKDKTENPIPYGDNYTVQGCIKKFHTYENFEKSIKDSSSMNDETIVILEPGVKPDETGLWAPGPNGITHLNSDRTVKDTVTGKDTRVTTIEHIKEALKVVDENSR